MKKKYNKYYSADSISVLLIFLNFKSELPDIYKFISNAFYETASILFNLKSFWTSAFLQTPLLCRRLSPTSLFDIMHSHTDTHKLSLPHTHTLISFIFVFVPIFNFRLACKLCSAFFLLFCLNSLASKKIVLPHSAGVCVCVCDCLCVREFIIF